jgi:amino acid transporter
MRRSARTVAGGVTLGVFALAMIEVTAVLGIRNFPVMAEEGWSMVFWYLFGLVAFFLPLSLVAGELATAWPQGGGIYAWVRQAFGERGGFIAIWCEWIEDVVWFPVGLTFIAATFAYAVSPALGTDPRYILVVSLGVLWAVTVVNLFGERYSARISTWGGVIGVIVPSALMIVLLVASIVRGDPSAVPFTPAALLPDFDTSTLPFAATVILVFCGMEMAGFHALETRDPARDFPRAIILAMVIVFVLTVLGTLAVMWVVPTKQLGLASGVMQAIQAMLDEVGAGWLTAPFAVLMSAGLVAVFSTWYLGPGKALGVAAAQGDMPPNWRRRNRHGSPVGVLFIQAGIATVLSLVFVLVPSVNAAYWILTAITTELIIVMYLFVFAAALKLRYSQPDAPRPYRVPGGKAGMWIVCGVALAALVFSLVVGVLPPNVVGGMSPAVYVTLLIAATVVLSLGAPLVFWLLRKPAWVAPDAAAYLLGEEASQSGERAADGDDAAGADGAAGLVS